MPEIEALLRTDRGVRAAERLTRAIERNISTTARWDRQMDRAERQVRRVGRAAGTAQTQLVGLLGAFGGIQAARTLTLGSDTYALAANRLQSLGVEASLAGREIRSLQRIADDNRTSFDAVIDTYQRFARAASFLGRETDLLPVLRGVTAAARLSGATPTERGQALRQLGQGVQSNRFGGEEFRSVSEQLGAILPVIARQLGVNVTQLRRMATQGQLTGEVIFDSFLNANEEIARSEGLTTTVGEAFTLLSNATNELGGDLQGLNNALAQTIEFFAGGVSVIGEWTDSITAAENGARALTLALGTTAAVGAFTLAGGFATIAAILTSPAVAIGAAVFSGTFLTGLITQTETAEDRWRDLGEEVERTAEKFERAAASGNRAAAAASVPQAIVALQDLREEAAQNFNMPLSSLPGGLQDPNLLVTAAERLVRSLGPRGVDFRRLTEPRMAAAATARNLLQGGDVDPFRIANEIDPQFLTLSQAQALGAIDDRIAMLRAEALGMQPGGAARGAGGAGTGPDRELDRVAQRISTNIARGVLDPLRQAFVDEDWSEVGEQMVRNISQALLEAAVFQPVENILVRLASGVGKNLSGTINETAASAESSFQTEAIAPGGGPESGAT